MIDRVMSDEADLIPVLQGPLALLSPAVGTQNVGDHFIELAIRRLLRDNTVFHRFGIRHRLTDDQIAAINGCAAAILCGTNLYQHEWESRLDLDVLNRLKVPIIPFGMGGSAKELVDVRVGQQSARMISALHQRCAVGGVRDPHAMNVVSGIGVTNAMLTGCPVLFWSRQTKLPPIKAKPRQRIVLTARNWLMHHWPDNVDHPQQIQFLRAIIDSFPADQLLFAAHEDFDERLIALLKLPESMVFRGTSAQDFIQLYTDPRNIVLAMRLHAGMLALANGLPTVFVGHDTRTYSFCQMMELEQVELFSPTAAEQAINGLRRIMAGDVSAFRHTAARYDQLRPAMQQFLLKNGLPAHESIAVAEPSIV